MNELRPVSQLGAPVAVPLGYCGKFKGTLSSKPVQNLVAYFFSSFICVTLVSLGKYKRMEGKG